MAGKPFADMGYTPPADRPRVARVRGYKAQPLGPSDEDRRRWQRFLAELPDRIARIRYDEAPQLCPTCGSTTPIPPEQPADVAIRSGCEVCGADLHEGARFCSLACYGVSKLTSTVEVVCPCGTAFRAFRRQIRRGRGKFCSAACSHKWRRRNVGAIAS